MIPTKKEIDVAWRGFLGEFVARLRIPGAVPPAPGRQNYFLVRPTGLISCEYVDPSIPAANGLDSLRFEERWQFEKLFRTELIVHRSVIQHGAILFIRDDRKGGGLVTG